LEVRPDGKRSGQCGRSDRVSANERHTSPRGDGSENVRTTGGLIPPGFIEAMSLRKAHSAPYRTSLKSPRCTRRRRASTAGPSRPAWDCGELVKAPEGAQKRADRACSSSNRSDSSMARRAGVRLPRPCRGCLSFSFSARTFRLSKSAIRTLRARPGTAGPGVKTT
jgi:hypothetical protein